MVINPHQMKHELRINNYVLYDNRPFQIASISDEYPSLKTIEFGFGVVEWKDIKPIPITEEALVKMGAIVTKKNNYNLNGMAITNFNGKFIEYVHQIELKGIHHLQNVYYFTRQTELTYEP